MAVTFRGATSSCTETTGGSRTAVIPTQTEAGDLIVAVVARSQTAASCTAFTSSGFTSRAFYPVIGGNYPVIGVLTATATSSDHGRTITFTSVGFSATDQFAVHILALGGVDTVNPVAAGPAKTDGASTSVAAPTLTAPTGGGELLTIHAAMAFNATPNLYHFSVPSGMTERTDLGGVWLCLATDTASVAAGATGARTAVFSTAIQNVPRGVSLLLRAANVVRTGAAAAPLKLAAARTGAKRATGTRTAALALAAARAGIKHGAGARTAALALDADGAGTKNALFARLRLAAAATGQTRHTATTGAATLRLHAAAAASSSRPGNTGTAPLYLAAVAVGLRLRSAVTGIPPRPSGAVTYELVCVARLPQGAGPPTLIEVDPIDWTGLSYTEDLNKPTQLSVGAQISALTDPVLQRLRDLAHNPCELHVFRNGRAVFAGPLLGWQVQGEAITFNAADLLAYTKMMIVAADLVFVQADQTAIAAALINQWQALPFGHFGIDTSGVTPSGVLRDATYLKKELHEVGQRVTELGARINGYDLTVDPVTRKLELTYPQRGVDRSSGPEAVVFDSRNVTSPNIVCSAAAGDVASEAYGTGTSTAGGDPVFATATNEELRARYGRTAVSATFDGVSEQSTLDDHTAGLLTVRDTALLVPGPNTRVTPDADLSAYDVGDTVAYQLHEKLGVQGSFRLAKRQVTVSQTGQEAVSIGFV